MTSRLPGTLLPALLIAATLAGCGAGSGKGKGGKGESGPTEVGYIVVQQTSVAVVTELSGRTSAYQTSEVRPQVSGIIRRRLFVEGSLVHKGQTLYEIDPSLYRAATSQAAANLASAQANAEATRVKAERYKPLADMDAVAKQDYTDAAAQARQAAAAVTQNRAALQTARINLNFTRVPAPITGRIGRSLFTEGALVTAGQADPLTNIQRLDPIYVDIQQSSADLLALRRALASGGSAPTTAVVRLKLEDGSDYGVTGTVEFTEAMVDATTGTVTLRARFANPNGLLLPGMFVRASFAQSLDTSAYLVPQVAVSRDPKGNATVFIVGPGNKAVPRTVTTSRVQGTNWIVTSGLNPGDKVITEGIGRLKPNDPVKPVPAGSPQRIDPTGGGSDKGRAGGTRS
ncbi:efflux RND transporter periplasmic adaptor subunit [Sphingomonas sp. AR_OL41]|uniref:efflux RND transporter periplasmic adaptor subunit n=1 Tax=Sphingomonas sp. AR_OL41 TaxID=3042729 RepID=UPI002480008B|nr:efflux RND transporter periplasmic adaptor subunit [Sphingomonas sp. AR_OL41]MDH7971804.1 efflux RND transporter periplasmic adaptor subunit [Sphingomonas sp. AR_OL41]